MPNKFGTQEESFAKPSVIEWMKLGKVGDSDTGTAYEKVQDVPEKMRVDEQATYIYVGYAEPGKATSSAVWRIRRVTNASGNTDWADGNALYDNVWDNRASLSYS